MNIAALIIGIDGWERYTAPLIESLAAHEPEVLTVVIDNASVTPYPDHPAAPIVQRTERLCYSAAINQAHRVACNGAWYGKRSAGWDWFIVLSNDVLCQGPFAHMLAKLPPDHIAGPCLKEAQGYQYLEGWCVCVPANIWDALGGWDERFRISSWEDVDYTQSTLEHGFNVAFCPDLPFVHLDQRQRFTLSANYWDSERHNIELFTRKRRMQG